MIHVVQNRYSGEQETHWDKTNKRLTSLKMVIFFVCLPPVRFLLTSIAVFFFCTTWIAAKGLLMVFSSHGVWGSRRTLITQSKTKLELVNRVISAEELEIRALPFSSDSTYDIIAYNLVKKPDRSRSRSRLYKPITMHVSTFCDWFSSSAFSCDSNSLVLSRS